MGLFSKMKESVVGTSAGSIDNARLGRGIISDVQISGTTITSGGIEQHVCSFTLEVALDDTPRYTATCRQRIPVWTMAQIQPGSTTVAVRVDAKDPSHVAIDWETPAPTVRAAAGGPNTGSAAEILARGLDCRVVIVQFQDMGTLARDGRPVYAFVLTVMPQSGAPYQIQVGNPVSPEALPLLYPGSQVPAKVLAEDQRAVCIDWAAALAATSKA